MMQELFLRFDNIIHHAISMWVVIIVITVMCATAVWAIKTWVEWYRSCFFSKKKDK